MDVNGFDYDRCILEEKQVVEGLCISYDLLRGLCLETQEVCQAMVDATDASTDQAASQA